MQQGGDGATLGCSQPPVTPHRFHHPLGLREGGGWKGMEGDGGG